MILISTVTKLVLGSITDISDYNGRSGNIYVTYPSEVKLGSILPENVWEPVDLNWRSIDDVTGVTSYIPQGYSVLDHLLYKWR